MTAPSKKLNLLAIATLTLIAVNGCTYATAANKRGIESKTTDKILLAQATGMRAKISDSAECSCGPSAPSFSDRPSLVVPMPSPAPNVVPESRGALVASNWNALPGWGRDNPLDAWQGFLKSCSQLRSQTPWQSVCSLAQTVPQNPSNSALVRFFEENFVPYQVFNPDGSNNGMITGYYEPLLSGSRTPTTRYRYPLYKVPEDLITVDLGDVYPELKNKRLRGRLEGNRVVPYLERGGIDHPTQPLKNKELVWVEDSIESFFLHIQGSGRVQFEDGASMRVGYADQNGHPFRSLGRLLMDKGELTLAQTSMQGIKTWARANPYKVTEFLNGNPSFVFFKELPSDLPGPIGTLGVPLTAERSIAVDSRVIPLGSPVFLATTYPSSKKPLNRLMLAQDTGGAINGAVRADFFWGFGDAAGKQAGIMKQQGQMWVLLPKDYSVPAN
jgi:membrane-bound lytic murein transglycosylase A